MKNKILIVIPQDTLYSPLYLEKIIAGLKEKDKVQKNQIAVCCCNPTHKSSVLQLLIKRFKLYGIPQFFIFLGLILSSRLLAKMEKYYPCKRSFNIKLLCERHGISYTKTDSVNSNSFKSYLKKAHITILISIAVGERFSPETLDQVEYPLNVHSSLLPKYRGIMGLFWAQLNKDNKAGVTIHRMVMDFDAGAILGQCEFPIERSESLHQLYLKAIENGSRLVAKTVDSVLGGSVVECMPDIPRDSYRSFPKKRERVQYHSQDNHFFKLRDLRINQK